MEVFEGWKSEKNEESKKLIKWQSENVKKVFELVFKIF
jgi:hypothetical protein